MRMNRPQAETKWVYYPTCPVIVVLHIYNLKLSAKAQFLTSTLQDRREPGQKFLEGKKPPTEYRSPLCETFQLRAMKSLLKISTKCPPSNINFCRENDKLPYIRVKM